MKTLTEIQRAHDLALGILLGEVPAVIKQEDLEKLAAATDALCWVLGHTHGKPVSCFQENLDRLEATLRKMGYELTCALHPDA